MRAGKHNLHFLVDVELLPHAFVNIPNETIHIGVFIFIFFIFTYVYSQFSTWWNAAVTLISISHLSSLPLIPNVKCIAWSFDGLDFVSDEDEGLRS
jgi:hypothetical protein